MAQSYLVTRDRVLSSVDLLDLDEKSADRARFALMQVTEAAAPTNDLLTNPTALRTLAETRGGSLVKGGRHLVHDVLHNGGMPSQVDTRPFGGSCSHAGRLLDRAQHGTRIDTPVPAPGPARGRDRHSSRRDLKLRSCATVGTCRREGSDWARLDSQRPAKAF